MLGVAEWYAGLHVAALATQTVAPIPPSIDSARMTGFVSHMRL
jgi:hypothetical protein